MDDRIPDRASHFHWIILGSNWRIDFFEAMGNSGVDLNCTSLAKHTCLAVLAALWLCIPQLSARQTTPESEFPILESAVAEAISCPPQQGDEIWLVNTRQVPDCCSNCCDADQLRVSECVEGCWRCRQLRDLFDRCESQPELDNLVYIHGNFTDYEWSLRRGQQVYQTWFANNSPRPPMRFIIWSWKSEREAIPVRDFLIKSDRAVAEGCRLNSLVSRLGPREPVVIGYSLGAQAALSALTQAENESGLRWRVALIAAALDADFCHQLNGNSQISDRLDCLLLFTNRADPALNCSNRIAKRRISGNPPNQYSILPSLPHGHERFEQYEIDCEVGRHHSISKYRQAPTVIANVQDLLSYRR